MSLVADASVILAGVLPVWAPPPSLKVSEWADRYRVLSPEASGEPGQWRTDRAPYQRGIMDALSDPAVEQVTVTTSAQVGKTEFALNAVGYFIHQDPSPIMVVVPSVEVAKKWSKTRLAPMLRDTPALREKVAEAKSRDDSNTIQEKTFPGGLLVIVGSNAPSGLASQPIRVVICDEVDRFEDSAGTEGDPVDLAFKRTTTFIGRRKHVLISTPGVKGTSRIEKAWEESDQRHFHVPCPHCQVLQTLRFAQLVWPEGRPLEAAYACSACGALITDGQKAAMLRDGVWIAARPEVKDHAGFHLNEIYSPWRRFGEIVRDFVKAKKRGIKSLQVWINTALGETWDPRGGGGVTPDVLMARREVFQAEVPRGVLLLTAGIDSQDDRLEIVVKGWGEAEENWTIMHEVFPGNLTLPGPWQALEAMLLKDWRHESGITLRIAAAAIDSGGHFTKQVMEFCRLRTGRGVFAVKGSSTPMATPVRRSKKRSRLWLVDTNTLKDMIFSRLRVETPGPGYMHFHSELSPDYFEQLTSEKLVPRRFGGSTVRAYEKVDKKARNEALDCEVYAAAALERLGVQDWEAMAERAEKRAAAVEHPGATQASEPPRPASEAAPEPPLSPVRPLQRRMPSAKPGWPAWRKGGRGW